MYPQAFFPSSTIVLGSSLHRRLHLDFCEAVVSEKELWRFGLTLPSVPSRREVAKIPWPVYGCWENVDNPAQLVVFHASTSR